MRYRINLIPIETNERSMVNLKSQNWIHTQLDSYLVSWNCCAGYITWKSQAFRIHLTKKGEKQWEAQFPARATSFVRTYVLLPSDIAFCKDAPEFWSTKNSFDDAYFLLCEFSSSYENSKFFIYERKCTRHCSLVLFIFHLLICGFLICRLIPRLQISQNL